MVNVDLLVPMYKLMILRNPRGGPIVSEAETAKKLLDSGASLEELTKLFSYADSQGNEKFFAEAVLTFMEHGGYTAADLLRVAELKDTYGHPILDSSTDFYPFMEIEGKIEAAEAVAQVRDSDGRTVYRIDRTLWGTFEGFWAITDLLKVGGNAQKAQELTEILDDDGDSVFKTPREINRFVENRGTPTYAKRLLALRDNEGKQIFDGFAIALLKECGGTIKYARSMADLKDTDGHTIFSNGIDVVHFYATVGERARKRLGNEKKVSVANRLANLKDSSGKTVFRDGSDIVTFLQGGGTARTAAAYIAIEDETGRTYFRGFEIALLKSHGVPPQYAMEMSRHGLNAATTMYHFKMRLSGQELDFSNSGKPKALVLYPTSDPYPYFLQGFSGKGTIAFLRKISGAYDFRMRAISSMAEFDRELEAAPELDLLVMGGHGSRKTLTFGESRPKYGLLIDDAERQLTTKSNGTRKSLARVKKGGVIFLDSCLNGEGRDSEINLANYVAENAPGVKVIASSAAFSTSSVEVNQLHPLDIRIFNGITDFTYVVRR